MANYAMRDLMAELAPDIEGVSSEVGTRGEVAFLRVYRTAAPERWAVVSTPGDRWFSLEIDGGFSLDHFEEETPTGDARRVVGLYVRLVAIYLTEGGVTVAARGGRRTRSVRLAAAGEEYVLRRSIGGQIRNLLRFCDSRERA